MRPGEGGLRGPVVQGAGSCRRGARHVSSGQPQFVGLSYREIPTIRGEL